MNTKFIFGLLIGAAVGVLGTKRYFEKKYQKLADEEVASVREKFTVPREDIDPETVLRKTVDIVKNGAKSAPNEVYADIMNSLIEEVFGNKKEPDGEIAEPVPKTPNVDVKDTKKEREAANAMNSYRGYSKDTVHNLKPFRISPDDFEENEPEHEHCTLYYYADCVVTDDNGCVIEHPKDILGADFWKGFGEYEQDAMYVRNYEEGVDYEVLKDMRRYKDTIKVRPKPVDIH